MRKIIITLIGILFLMPFVSAHAIEEGPITKSTENYNIEFSVDPKFPVTSKDTHLDFIIKDKVNNLISDLNAKIELHKEDKTITLDLNEEQNGHYSVEYKFNEPGDYEIHIITDNEELGIEFDLEIDSFGLSGLLRSGVIIVLLSILILLMYKDCRRLKNGKESSSLKNTKM